MEFQMFFKKIKQFFTRRAESKVDTTEKPTTTAKQYKHKQMQQHKLSEELTGFSLHWEKIQSTEFELLPIEPFTEDFFPPCLYKYAYSNAVRLDGAPIEYMGVSIVISLAAVLGCGVRIQPKLNDSGWLEPSNLWGLIVGNPSTKKSPCMKVGMAPIKNLQNGENGESFCFIINDATYEAACVKAELYPNGIMLVRDEFAGWLESIDRPDKSQERAFYLEGYSVTDYEQIRIGRDKVTIKDLTISILGGTQPTKLLKLLRSRANGTNNDGLFERFQLAVFPNTRVSEYVDMKPDLELAEGINRIFRIISTISTPDEPKVFSFDEQAQNTWNQWASKFKQVENQSTEEEQAVMGKYPALCAKLALIMHLVKEAEQHQELSEFLPSYKVTEESLNMATRWVKLLWSHNKRIQHFGSYYSQEDKAELLIKRLAMVKNEPFSLRDVYRGAMEGLKKAHEVRSAANELIERGYLQTKTVQTSGTNNKLWYFRHPDLIKQMNKK
jgi:hypothetical protein